MLRAVAVAVALLAAALWAPAAALAGHFDVNGNTIVYTPEPQGEQVDKIAGFETATHIRFTTFGGAGIGPGVRCELSAGGQIVDCEKAGVTTVVLNLGDGDDVAAVSPTLTANVIFQGGEGADGLFGGGGVDFYDGGPGDDNIVARDGRAESVECGAGNDTAITDDSDVRGACEEIEGDADADGVRRPADCDDTRPGIRPGAPDVPDNGVDEDCSGTDAVNTDRDGDGVPRPQDCDDTTAAIRPGGEEVIGNAVDENCDRRVEPLPPLTGKVSSTWTKVGRRTRNLTLVATGFPSGTRVELRCTGARRCPRGVVRRRVARGRRTINLHPVLGRRLFRPGVRISVRFARPRRVGRVMRYQMRAADQPRVDFLCQPPGASAGPC